MPAAGRDCRRHIAYDSHTDPHSGTSFAESLFLYALHPFFPPQFNFWAITASPMLISANIRNMSVYNLRTYTNADVREKKGYAPRSQNTDSSASTL